MWRCPLKTCWCWWWGSCWQQFVADFEAEVWLKKLNFCSDFEHKVWSRFWSWSSGKIWSWSLVSILKLVLDPYCVWPSDMTKISYFGKQNSTLGSVVPLAMFPLMIDFDFLTIVLRGSQLNSFQCATCCITGLRHFLVRSPALRPGWWIILNNKWSSMIEDPEKKHCWPSGGGNLRSWMPP